MKKLAVFFLSTQLLLANTPPPSLIKSFEPKILIENSIIANVNGTTISMLDVVKKMDLYFLKAYPNLENAKSQKFQFYNSSWRYFLSEIINAELMIADSKEKEIVITDGEIREEMEKRFSPNIMLTLDNINLSYDDAWDMIKRELIVQRMSWFYIHSKALQEVTPHDIRLAYQEYLNKNPPTTLWTYRVISFNESVEGKGIETADELYRLLTKAKPEDLEKFITDLKDTFSDVKIQLTSEYHNNSEDISKSHKDSLKTLTDNSYSKPISQPSRSTNKLVTRIFYLKNSSINNPSTFSEMSNELKNQLIQKQAQKQSEIYIVKLKERYGYNNNMSITQFPKDFQPFQLK